MNTRVAWAMPGHARPLPRRPGRLARAARTLGSYSVLAAGFLASDCWAQDASVTSSTNFHQTAGGRRLGSIRPGASVELTGRTSGSWSEIVLTGWIWSGSVNRTTRDGFNLVVSVAGGENFRDAPSTRGAIQARLLQGFLLERLGTSGSWIRARRTGWVAASVLDASTPGAAEAGAPASREGRGSRGQPGMDAARAEPEDRLVVGEAPARLHVSPEGDTLAVVRSGADLTVLARQGGWARVRLNGWVRVAEVTAPDSAVGRLEVSAADLRANPDEYRGRQLRWSVQFVSLERAEAVRTDFYEGEPFILARAPDPAEGFVYLAVPPELLSVAEGLAPLEMIEVLARVRRGRSAIMGAPVLDLLAFY